MSTVFKPQQCHKHTTKVIYYIDVQEKMANKHRCWNSVLNKLATECIPWSGKGFINPLKNTLPLINLSWKYFPVYSQFYWETLTHWISRWMKIRGSRNLLMGTVRMRTKGKASEAWVDMTAQSPAKHTTWIPVKRCICRVRTWNRQVKGQGDAQAGRSFIEKLCYSSLWEPTDLPHIRMVWVIFGWHQQQHHALCQLDTVQGHNPHVEKNAKQNSNRDLP